MASRPAPTVSKDGREHVRRQQAVRDHIHQGPWPSSVERRALQCMPAVRGEPPLLQL